MERNNYVAFPGPHTIHEAVRYLKVPYEEPFGCFMLVKKFMEDSGITIPDYTIEIPDDNAYEKAWRLQKYICEHAREIPRDMREYGDVILFNMAGIPAHIGIYVGEGKVLHSLPTQGATIEPVDSVKWRRRVNSYWRVYSCVRAYG